ncbi:MAG: hypothetical protein GY862_19330, partial [Gammaproteobacteria bacterium]|nr:hypothetical protein [Gammaproteobacteria bacterium]
MLNAPHQEKTEENLAACCASLFDMTWMNYYLQLPKTGAVELDVLAEGEDADACWALVLEVKSCNEKNLPTLAEAKSFAAKAGRVRRWL